MTRRYELGQLLGSISRHLLLMTATPHSGSDDNFAAFLSLLDEGRFAGHQLPGAPPRHHWADAPDGQRGATHASRASPVPRADRRDGPLRPSDGELELYEAVTHYVREEMNRAESQGDSPQRRTVGFALTVLQRRLASSTHAILRSLQRRRDRLTTMRAELKAGRNPFADTPGSTLPTWTIPTTTTLPNTRPRRMRSSTPRRGADRRRT